jgi:hypothetical protein
MTHPRAISPENSFTFHTLERCKTWDTYHSGYYRWMVKHSSPLLAESNYNASTWKDRMIQQRLIAPP